MAKQNYTYEFLSVDRAAWYGANQACYIVRFDGGFAPIFDFAAIKDKKFTDNPAKGYIHGNGNTGTGSMLLTDLSFLK